MLDQAYQTPDSQANEDITPELFPRRKKVMIIDDDMDFRLSVSEILVDHGYKVMTAKDGEMGLNHLVHERDLPDLILVDLMMPIKSGLEFRREQSTLAGLSDIPVIFVSGHGIVDGEICIQKPFTADEFIDQVKKFI